MQQWFYQINCIDYVHSNEGICHLMQLYCCLEDSADWVFMVFVDNEKNTFKKSQITVIIYAQRNQSLVPCQTEILYCFTFSDNLIGTSYNYGTSAIICQLLTQNVPVVHRLLVRTSFLC